MLQSEQRGCARRWESRLWEASLRQSDMADYNELTAVFVESPNRPTVGSEIEHVERLLAHGCSHEASKAVWNLAGGGEQAQRTELGGMTFTVNSLILDTTWG